MTGGPAPNTIFITGAGSGIGRATAELFARRGWFVGLSDVDDSALAETAAGLSDGSFHTQLLDVRDPAAWSAALASFEAVFERPIHVVFNNAGVGIAGPFDRLHPDEIDTLIDVNVRGLVHGARAAHPFLVRSAPHGVLVNMSSAAGLYGTCGLALYSATKCAVRGLSEALDLEWRRDGIRVRVVMPGFVDTPILDGPNSREVPILRRESIVRTGYGFIPVEEVADAVWRAVHVHGGVHVPVGRVARQLAFGVRFAPGLLRAQLVRVMRRAGLGS